MGSVARKGREHERLWFEILGNLQRGTLPASTRLAWGEYIRFARFEYRNRTVIFEEFVLTWGLSASTPFPRGKKPSKSPSPTITRAPLWHLGWHCAPAPRRPRPPPRRGEPQRAYLFPETWED